MESKGYELEKRQFWIAHKSPGGENEPTIAFENARYTGQFLGIQGNWLCYKRSKTEPVSWTLKPCEEEDNVVTNVEENKGNR